MEIHTINELCKQNKIRWTNHALVRLIQRGIYTNEVVHALQNGAIIEQYPDDYPHPSCLVLGVSHSSKPMHIVCGLGEDEIWIITAYHPNPSQWDETFMKRKERESS